MKFAVVVMFCAMMEWEEYDAGEHESKLGCYSDIGCLWIGAYLSTEDGFQLQCPQSWDAVHITVKELVHIVVGAAVWVRQWAGKTVRCRLWEKQR